MGYASSRRYSGIVGFGIQIAICLNVGCFHGFGGIEAVWFAFTGNNNFGNGFIPWIYAFVGGSFGLTFDFSALLSPNLISSPKNVLRGFGFTVSCAVSITCFLVTAKSMSTPNDYTRSFDLSSVTVYGVTASKAWGDKISTYGIGITWEIGFSGYSLSIGKKLFGFSGGSAFYWMLPINSNAKVLYNAVRKKV